MLLTLSRKHSKSQECHSSSENKTNRLTNTNARMTEIVSKATAIRITPAAALPSPPSPPSPLVQLYASRILRKPFNCLALSLQSLLLLLLVFSCCCVCSLALGLKSGVISSCFCVMASLANATPPPILQYCCVWSSVAQFKIVAVHASKCDLVVYW